MSVTATHSSGASASPLYSVQLKKRLDNPKVVISHLFSMAITSTIAKLGYQAHLGAYGSNSLSSYLDHELTLFMAEVRQQDTPLDNYTQILKDSRELNNMIGSLSSVDDCHELEDEIAKGIMQALREGKRLLLDCGMYRHAMRLGIETREGGELLLTLYDSKGYVECYQAPIFSLPTILAKPLRKSMLQLACSKELWEQKAEGYLKSFFHLFSKESLIQEQEARQTATFTLLSDINRWKRAISTFASLNPSSLTTVDKLCSTNLAPNCTAKRMQLAAKTILEGNYKKLTFLRLEKLKKALIFQALLLYPEKESFFKQFNNQQPQLMAAENMKQVAQHLSGFKELPDVHHLELEKFWQGVFDLIEHKKCRAKVYWANEDAYSIQTFIDEKNRKKIRKVSFANSDISPQGFLARLDAKPELLQREDCRRLLHFFSTDRHLNPLLRSQVLAKLATF